MFSCTKIFILLTCSLVIALAKPADNDTPALGSARLLEGEELQQAEQELQNTLTKLASGEGPNYTITKVYWATKQVVAGTLTKLDVDLTDANEKVKHCKVGIWSRPWIKVDGVEVTFDCTGEQNVVKKYNP